MSRDTALGRPLPAGLHNFRDLGGLPVLGGRATRRGLVFRSDSLHYLTAEGARVLVQVLGVRSIVDLRATLEQASTRPGWIAEGGVDYVNLPFSDGFDEIDPALDERGLRELVGRKYERYLAVARANIVEALERVAVAVDEGRPVVFNCTYGKDRTGVLAAIMLELVEVEREAVVADYVASQSAMPPLLARMAADPVHGPRITLSPKEVYRADEQSVRRFLDRLDNAGGAVAWAVDSGLLPSVVDRLRERLVE